MTEEFKLTVGADPEFFLELDGKPVSAHTMVPGTKDKPHKLKHGAVQLDGMAVEFNIDPASTAEEFSHNIHEVLKQIRQMIPVQYKFSFKPSVFFEPYYFEQVPEQHKELGCNPDFNAYTELMNPAPDTSAYPTMRTGAGHIHIGWTKGMDKKDYDHLRSCRAMIKRIDNYYQHYAPLFDSDKTRQNLYGKNGCFRPTTYGVEYRTPSNAWVQYPKLYPWMFDFTKACYDSLVSGSSYAYPPDYSNSLKRSKWNG